MTGRELIIYILQNGLEDKDIFKDGIFAGFMTVGEAAVKFDVGFETVKMWYAGGLIDGFTVNEEIYIFKDAKKPTIENQVSVYKRFLGIK